MARFMYVRMSLLQWNLFSRIPASDQASSDTPIHYRNASCNGTESKLTDCDLGDSTAEGDECTHRDDVAIVCKRSELVPRLFLQAK